MKKLGFAALFVGGLAVAGIVELDRAATSLENTTEHFHETAHFEAPGSHIDIDAHELAEKAAWFHEEVHHGHPMWQLQSQFRVVKSAYSHTSHTMFGVRSPHLRADFRLVRNDIYNVDHAFWWGHGPIHGGFHH